MYYITYYIDNCWNLLQSVRHTDFYEDALELARQQSLKSELFIGVHSSDKGIQEPIALFLKGKSFYSIELLGDF